MFKKLMEYKINLYSAILNNLFAVFVQIIMIFVLSQNLAGMINWSKKEYIFFVLFYNFMFRCFGGLLFFGSRLRFYLIKGDLNKLILKPINTFLQYSLQVIPFQAIIISSSYLLGLMTFVFYYFEEINFMRLFLTFILGLTGIIFQAGIIRIFDSLAFFIKQNQFLDDTYSSSSKIFIYFPAHIFKNDIKYFSLIFGNLYFGVYATLFLFSQMDYGEYFIMIFSLFISIFSFIMIVKILWHYGLKKYEAFG